LAQAAIGFDEQIFGADEQVYGRGQTYHVGEAKKRLKLGRF